MELGDLHPHISVRSSSVAPGGLKTKPTDHWRLRSPFCGCRAWREGSICGSQEVVLEAIVQWRLNHGVAV